MATSLSVELIGSGFRTALVNLGNVSGDVNINVNRGNEFLLTPTGNTTISFTGLPPSGQVAYWSLEIRARGSNTVTFEALSGQVLTFDGGTPTIASGARSTVLAFRCRDGQTIVGAISYSDIPG